MHGTGDRRFGTLATVNKWQAFRNENQANMARFKLTSGVKERDIQREILLSLVEEQFYWKKDKAGKLRKHSKNLFVAEGAFYWRANSGHLRGASGRPIQVNSPGCADVLGVVRGTSVAIEVKTEEGKQSSEQREWQAIFEASGGLYVVARCPREAKDFVAMVGQRAA